MACLVLVAGCGKEDKPDDPAGWRVPTKDDFVSLDILLGGTGAACNACPELLQAYVSNWGGAFGGYANDGAVLSPGTHGYYWSSTENSSTTSYRLHLSGTSSNVNPQATNAWTIGYPVRCVR